MADPWERGMCMSCPRGNAEPAVAVAVFNVEWGTAKQYKPLCERHLAAAGQSSRLIEVRALKTEGKVA